MPIDHDCSMEKKERKLMCGARGVSRFYAVQTLYKAALCNCKISDMVDESSKIGEIFVSESISVRDIDMDFFKKLLDIVDKNVQPIDDVIINNLSKNWKLERICSVTKCILRLGIAELMFFKEIPANVIFNEYIEISKAFFEKKEVSFINGLLNKAFVSVR
jgi:N utilization substance protein B